MQCGIFLVLFLEFDNNMFHLLCSQNYEVLMQSSETSAPVDTTENQALLKIKIVEKDEEDETTAEACYLTCASSKDNHCASAPSNYNSSNLLMEFVAGDTIKDNTEIV